jgi:large subunit ribosomal protein L29
MDAKELRQFSPQELAGRVRQWKDELFRSKFKAESTEAKDTSVFKKLRRDIARAKTILNEKLRSQSQELPKPTASANVEDKTQIAQTEPASDRVEAKAAKSKEKVAKTGTKKEGKSSKVKAKGTSHE